MKTTTIRIVPIFLAVAALAAIGGWHEIGGLTNFQSRRTTANIDASGNGRLTSISALPPLDGAQCEWELASASGRLRAAFMANSAVDIAGSKQVDRAPRRVIRDTYATYSAVAVDLNSNEVYLQDENLFGFKVFNRTDNTPPSAAMTEPKRVVAGINTKLEFNCGLYVDPKNGDVYSVNNDTLNTMVVFPRDAKGNVAPARQLETPHGTYGIAVDEGARELFLTSEHSNAVVVFDKMADGEAKPLRTIEGPATRLADPHGLALDTKNGFVYAGNHGNFRDRRKRGSGVFAPPSISVFPIKGKGNIAPVRTIAGPKTQLNWPAHLAFDEERQEIYVANDVGDSILVFRADDSGDVAPSRAIRGAKTGLKNPVGIFIDDKNKELWVSNMGNHSATAYALDASGDAAPLRTIRSSPKANLALAIGNPGAVTYDTKREEILVPN